MTSDLTELGYVLAAVCLCGIVGLEREWHQKSAGLRTHTLVGVGSALFMLVSKYGFTDVVGEGVTLDPSRVAAQIVSGVGFIGAGLIFVRRDSVRGLTTAASIWLAASIGAACGAGMLVVAAGVTGIYLVMALGSPWLVRVALRRSDTQEVLRVGYLDGRGILRDVVGACTSRGFQISDLELAREPRAHPGGGRLVDVRLELRGPRSTDDLVSRLSELDGVAEVSLAEYDESA